jgi:hypothetical protein
MKKQFFYRSPDGENYGGGYNAETEETPTYEMGNESTDENQEETPVDETETEPVDETQQEEEYPADEIETEPVDETQTEEETPVDETETEPVDETQTEEETPVDETETEPVDETQTEEEYPVNETETEQVDETQTEEEAPVDETETEPVDETQTEEKTPVDEIETEPVDETQTEEETPVDDTSSSNDTNTNGAAAIDWKSQLTTFADEYPTSEKASLIAAIQANRENVPEHLTAKNKVRNGHMYDPFSGKSQPQPADIQPDTIEAWIWEELKSEGSYTSINTYDNMVVTWGRGIAGSNIAKVLKGIFASNPAIEAEFNNVGIGLDANGILQVVDTAKNSIKTGNFALQTIKSETKLLDFLVDISLNENYKNVFLEAQWNFAKAFNPGFIAFAGQNNWSKDAVQLMFHLSWWLPAYGWVGHAQEYKNSGGDPLKIILIFVSHFKAPLKMVPYLKIFAGNAFRKYVAKEAYKAEPSGESVVFEDAGVKYFVPKP